MTLGSTVGYILGNKFQGAALGVWLGAGLGATLVMLADARHAQRLLDWLRGDTAQGAPRDTGHWGEIGYRIEKALRARERAIEVANDQLEQFLSGIEASPNGVLLLDANDQLTWCNSVAAAHFGLDPQRDLLQRVTNLIRSPAFVASLQSRQYDEATQLSGLADKHSLTVLMRPYGEGLKLVLSQDTTEREQTQAMQRDFVANVSHEIRTPLTVLAGFIETMMTLPLSEAERARVLELMSQQATRMQLLVADLLTLAKLEGSPRPMSNQWVTVASLMQCALADAAALSGNRHDIAYEGGGDGEIAGSEQEMLSAVGNLLTNAIRYTPVGGRIRVLWSWREQGGADLAIVDDGPGIGREHLARLTERFYRVDDSRSRATGGTGLGLSIVKHVMLRHGGEVTVASEVGSGSRFCLTFPASRVRHGEVNEPRLSR